jgi:hypothetical protein
MMSGSPGASGTGFVLAERGLISIANPHRIAIVAINVTVLAFITIFPLLT